MIEGNVALKLEDMESRIWGLFYLLSVLASMEGNSQGLEKGLLLLSDVAYTLAKDISAMQEGGFSSEKC